MNYVVEKKCKPIETEISGPTKDPKDFVPEEGVTYKNGKEKPKKKETKSAKIFYWENGQKNSR